MSSVEPVRAVLMAAEIQDRGHGFHRLVFKVQGGRTEVQTVTVMISQDACRKLTAQLARARVHRMDRPSLLKLWARWELALRLDELGVLPGVVTITSSDLDDSGVYAMALARVVAAS